MPLLPTRTDVVYNIHAGKAAPTLAEVSVGDFGRFDRPNGTA
jgi:hypothetical protein